MSAYSPFVILMKENNSVNRLCIMQEFKKSTFEKKGSLFFFYCLFCSDTVLSHIPIFNCLYDSVILSDEYYIGLGMTIGNWSCSSFQESYPLCGGVSCCSTSLIVTKFMAISIDLTGILYSLLHSNASSYPFKKLCPLTPGAFGGVGHGRVRHRYMPCTDKFVFLARLS